LLSPVALIPHLAGTAFSGGGWPGQDYFCRGYRDASNKEPLLGSGISIDSTLTSVHSSTKSDGGLRYPEMHQTKKGNQFYSGMKAQVGVDAESGLVHAPSEDSR